MGNTALLATMAAALVASVALVNADYSVLSTADSQTRDEQNVLAERAATSAFEMAASQLRRDFQTWRTGYGATSYLGGTFAAEVGGPATGPIRIQARGVNADTVSVAITGWMSRLAAASGALTIDADTAMVALRGANVVVSGVDHRASSWKNGDMSEGNGLAEPVIGLLASQSGSHYAVNQALGTGANATRVRGINGNGDVGLGGLPTDFVTLLGEAVGFRTRTLTGGQTLNATYGTAEAPAVVQVTGDVTFTGGGGFGLLYVEGSFEASSDFAWEGIVIADGENQMDFKLSGNASIRGAAYVTHTATNDRTVHIGNTTTKPYTLWAPDDETGHLRFYSFGDSDGDGSPDYSHGIEGDLRGWVAPAPNNGDYADSEALAFGPDGTLYIVDNPVQNDGKNRSRLYKVAPDQLDGNPATPVNVTNVGRTYRDLTTNVNNADEVHGLVFYQGKLYGIGARNETVYDISLVNGRANTVRTFTLYDSGGGTDQLDARALTADGDGNVYVSNVNYTGTRIYKFDSFPNGNAREVMRVNETVSGIGFHPDGYMYGYDREQGKIYRMDVERGTSEVMMNAVSGDIEDMALFFAGEMAAMGLNESPQLSDFDYFRGEGTRRQRVSWPGLGTAQVSATLHRTVRNDYPDIRGRSFQSILGVSTISGAEDREVGSYRPLEYTGPAELPMLYFRPGYGYPRNGEYNKISIEFDQALPRGQDLYLYISDLDRENAYIIVQDEHGTWLSPDTWEKAASVDVLGSDDGSRTTLRRAGNYAYLVPNQAVADAEHIIDEIRIPADLHPRAVQIWNRGEWQDYMGIGLTTVSVFQESGTLTVDMRDNASIRYSAEAIGKLAVRLPTIASASWFETFDRFAEAEVDRMFGLERRVKRGEERPRGPLSPGSGNDTTESGGSSGTSGTTGGSGGTSGTTGGGGGTSGTSGGGVVNVYVCHKSGRSKSTVQIPLLTLPTHLAHGDSAGQCKSGSGGSGSGKSGSGKSGSGKSGSGKSGSGKSGSGGSGSGGSGG